METLVEPQSRRQAAVPKKRAVKRVSADEHLRADPANKRALDQAIAQIERGETVRFDPRKRRKGLSNGLRAPTRNLPIGRNTSLTMRIVSAT